MKIDEILAEISALDRENQRLKAALIEVRGACIMKLFSRKTVEGIVYRALPDQKYGGEG